MKNEQVLFKIQALVDNELPEREIPEVLSLIEGNYEYRDEYVQLLKLKHRLAQVPFPSAPPVWFEPFERRRPWKVFLALGSISALAAGFSTLLLGLLRVFSPGNGALPALPGIAILSAGASALFFLIHAVWYRIEEGKGKSYKEILR